VADLDRQKAVDHATNGCLVIVALLGLATVGSAALAFTSVGTAVLATLLILSGLVLGAMEWAERG
jgi:hypothetical protein